MHDIVPGVAAEFVIVPSRCNHDRLAEPMSATEWAPQSISRYAVLQVGIGVSGAADIARDLDSMIRLQPVATVLVANTFRIPSSRSQGQPQTVILRRRRGSW